MNSRKVWNAQSIRALARARLKHLENNQGPQDLDSPIKVPVLPSDDSYKVINSEHKFNWGNFRESIGDKVFLVVPQDVDENRLGEIKQLCETLGLSAVAHDLPKRKKNPSPSTYLGKGYLENLASRIVAEECVAVVVDASLTPSQVKNIEKILEAPVLDREGVILGIFERHATSAMAKMQVELARLKYLQPRLAGIWQGLSRQRGAKGGLKSRGQGETRLELDRRVLKDRIVFLQKKLKELEKSLKVQSTRRSSLPRIALVGYTNAGKSTLMQKLTGSEVEASKRLFSTLDTTIKPLVPPTYPKILISDTVGFVRDLPHGLVASFKSTLKEASESRLILHVLDVSQKNWFEQFETTELVLEELGMKEKPRILVLNKTDLMSHVDRFKLTEINRVLRKYPQYLSVMSVSALKNIGIDELKAELIRNCDVSIPEWSTLR